MCAQNCLYKIPLPLLRENIPPQSGRELFFEAGYVKDNLVILDENYFILRVSDHSSLPSINKLEYFLLGKSFNSI